MQKRTDSKVQLLNCAAWNLEQAKRAEGLGDEKLAERLLLQARQLYEQADKIQ